MKCCLSKERVGAAGRVHAHGAARSAAAHAKRACAALAALMMVMVALSSWLAGCATVSQPTVLRGDGLGATWTVKLAAPAPENADVVRRGIQARVDEVARHLSRWEPHSSLNGLNAAPGNEWQAVPDGLLKPLSYALWLAADTGGAYDPTVAALVDVWGFGTSGRRYDPPSAAAVSAARDRVGHSKVTLDTSGSRVRRPGQLQIDLSSMTHGFAADRIAEYLDGMGVRSYLVDVGGEFRARGATSGGGAWHVAIETPPAEVSDARHAGPRVISLRDAGVATSGNYRYYFDYNGRRYSHRIDPRTGEPVTHSLVSVTVIAPECMHADALATALTVLGPDEGLQYATRRDIAALFVMQTADGLVERMTPRFAAYLN